MCSDSCPELKILANAVAVNAITLEELKHDIRGNSKEGMKMQLAKLVISMGAIIPKIDGITKDMGEVSKERVIRKLKDEMEEAARKSGKVIFMSIFEKIISPIIVAVTLYLLLK